MSSTSSSVVLGLSARMPPHIIEPFVCSLRATSYKGRIALIVAQYGPEELRRIRRMVDDVMVVDGEYEAPPRFSVTAIRSGRRFAASSGYDKLFTLATGMRGERAARSCWRSLEYRFQGLQSLRYGHYYDYLTKHAPHAEQVLLTDVRDVFFQDDPFSVPLTGLEVFLEDPSHRLASERHNAGWIADLYGHEALTMLGDYVVSCSGTVAGDRSSILHYLKEMIEATAWRRRPMGARDQGVHNYLLRTGRFPDAKVVDNGGGRVMTMDGMRAFSENNGGQIQNSDGTIPAVVHQYDRHQELADRVTSLFSFPK